MPLNAPQCFSMPHTAPQCPTLPHTAPKCLSMLLNASQCPTLPHTAPKCLSMPHTALQCSSMPHTAPQCPTPPPAAACITVVTRACSPIQRCVAKCQQPPCTQLLGSNIDCITKQKRTFFRESKTKDKHKNDYLINSYDSFVTQLYGCI